MIMKQVLWILLAFVLLCACEEKHFMTDPDYRRMVEQDFQKKRRCWKVIRVICLPCSIPR